MDRYSEVQQGLVGVVRWPLSLCSLPFYLSHSLLFCLFLCLCLSLILSLSLCLPPSFLCFSLRIFSTILTGSLSQALGFYSSQHQSGLWFWIAMVPPLSLGAIALPSPSATWSA